MVVEGMVMVMVVFLFEGKYVMPYKVTMKLKSFIVTWHLPVGGRVERRWNKDELYDW